MITFSKLSVFTLLATALLMTSCKKDKDNGSSGESSTIKMNLTDAPVDYDAVYIDIQDIRVHIDHEDGGWKTLENVERGIYNLLDFTNGVDTLLAEGDVPAGKISQVRLILGMENSVVIDGVSHELKTPSAQQSGLKLNVHEELEPNLEYEFWLDFDAGRSIVSTGNGKYILKPVIRVFTSLTTGSIEGYVDPVAAHPAVLAYNSAGDSASARADLLTGYFLLSGLNPASYTVEFDAVDPFMDTNVSGVAVSTGDITTMDTVNISQ